MAVILDGKLTSQKVREKIRAEVDSIPEGVRRPGLAVIIVGDDPASRIYVRNKINLNQTCRHCRIFKYIQTLA